MRFQQKIVVFSQIFQFFTINGGLYKVVPPQVKKVGFCSAFCPRKSRKKQSPSYPTYKPMGMYLTKLYPLVNYHSYGKWPIEIDGLSNKHGDFL